MPDAPPIDPQAAALAAWSALTANQRDQVNTVLLGLKLSALAPDGSATGTNEGADDIDDDERPAKKSKTTIYDSDKDIHTHLICTGHFYPIGVHPHEKFDTAAKHGTIEKWVGGDVLAKLTSTQSKKAKHDRFVSHFEVWYEHAINFNSDHELAVVLRFLFLHKKKAWQQLVADIKEAARDELHQATFKVKFKFEYLLPNPLEQHLYPGLPNAGRVKTGRGVSHPYLLRLLLSPEERKLLPECTFTPADATLVPEDDKGKELLTKVTKSTHKWYAKKHLSAWYADYTVVGRGNVKEGLFESFIIIRFLRHYLIGPGHALLGLGDDPIPPQCPARRHGVDKVTVRMLAHVLCEIRTMLTTADWGDKDGDYDYNDLVNRLIAFCNKVETKEWTEALLERLTKAVFNSKDFGRTSLLSLWNNSPYNTFCYETAYDSERLDYRISHAATLAFSIDCRSCRPKQDPNSPCICLHCCLSFQLHFPNPCA
ncbi:hypothetical protein MKEN_00834400 [Mycena kentingensis (nom. inval.)]|nr:hypothetical protein MKEN_00834400 [Mycena kentingensis (nom. inval.)]